MEAEDKAMDGTGKEKLSEDVMDIKMIKKHFDSRLKGKKNLQLFRVKILKENKDILNWLKTCLGQMRLQIYQATVFLFIIAGETK